VEIVRFRARSSAQAIREPPDALDHYREEHHDPGRERGTPQKDFYRRRHLQFSRTAF
jgi:hypothetical protein